MPTETIEFTVSGLSQAVGGMNTMASAVAGVSIPGAGAISGLSALTSALAKMPAPAVAAVTAIGAVGAALIAFVALSQTAAHSLQEFGTLQATLASNAHDTAFLQLAGQLTGQNAGAAASSVRQGAFSGNGALAYSSLGINLPPPMDVNGAFDEGANLLRIFSAITKQLEQDSALALMNIRRLHLEGFTPLFEGGEQVRQMLDNEARLREKINTPEHIANAIKFNTQMEVMKAKLLDAAVVIGEKMIPTLSKLIDAAEWLAKHSGSVLDVIPGYPIFRWLENLGKGGTQRTQDGHTKAMQDHTAALNNSVRDQRFGQFGGGNGFRSAIPGGYQNSVQAGQALQGQAAQWGAYALGM